MNTQKLADMADVMKRLMHELSALEKHNAISRNSANSQYTSRRRANARESARECSIEIRRLKHEAHCLAVELGLADLRPDAFYADSTAPAGFGNTTIFTKRKPTFRVPSFTIFGDEVRIHYGSHIEAVQQADMLRTCVDSHADLLEALKNLLAVHECEGGTKYHAGDIARAAIAKATA